jgi:Phage tail repeat like
VKIKLNIITSNAMKYPVTVDISEVDGLQTALDNKSPIGHSHVIGDVSGLQSAIDGKSPIGHSHVIGDVTGLQTAITDLYSPLLSFPYEVNDFRYPVVGTVATGTSAASNTLVWVPWYNYSTFSASSLGFRNAQNSGLYQVGIYSMRNDGSPDTRLWQSGDLDGSVNSWKDIAVPITLNRGWYWFATLTNATVQILASPQILFPLDGVVTGTAAPVGGYQLSTVYSSGLPSVAPAKQSLTIASAAAAAIFRAVPYFRYR